MQSNFVFVPIEYIHTSRFQQRDGEDPAHIDQLAGSIARAGLQQIPKGRPVLAATGEALSMADLRRYGPIEAAWESNARVELAFGNSRLAAFVILHGVEERLRAGKEVGAFAPPEVVEATQAALAAGETFDAMPVFLQEYTDEDMFELGIRENNDRKNLNALETARAMEVYRSQFNKTSAEIGSLFHLSDSAVRGKLRLLGLPEDLQARLAGAPELALREILVLLELPEDYRKRAQETWEASLHPSAIIDMAANGATADAIAARVTTLIAHWGKDLSEAPWTHDREDWAGAANVRGACKGCPLRFQRNGKQYCLDSICFAQKEHVWQIEYLRQASLLSGIPVYDDGQDTYLSVTEFGYTDEPVLKTARQAGCENLALAFKKHQYSSNQYARVPDFEKAEIICRKRKGFCTCGTAVRAGVQLAAATESAPAQPAQPGGAGELPVETDRPTQEAPKPALTADDLKEVAREVRQHKRQNITDVRAISNVMVGILAQALKDQNPVVWFHILRAITYSGKEGQPFEATLHEIARHLVVRIYSAETSYGDPTPTAAVKAYNAVLHAAGLEDLDGVPGMPEDELQAEETPAGKTLAEVFSSAD